jgi:polysaccharide biosynthesis transport protein
MVFKMRNPLVRYKGLAKRWIWVILLGVVLCGGASYVISKLIHPVYQASALIFLNLGSSNTSPYESTNASLTALPTYAQLLTSPTVLKPVIAQHKGLTLNQLTAMISVQPQANTQLIQVDVQSTDPQLAMQLANEVSQNFAQYANAQLPATMQILPAELPTTPVSPKPSSNAVIGVLVGLVLAFALIVIFEWIDDRLTSLEEVQEILGLDTLAVLPQLSRKQRSMDTAEIPTLAEACRVLCASLNAIQANNPFKLIMVTSALAGEGKSTVAVNLASFLAMTGKKVLLVDANLRHPTLDQHFQLDNQQGFSSAFLEKRGGLESDLDGRLTDIPTLRVLTAGVLPSNPTEMLQSPLAQGLFDLFKKSPRFDYVIFDAPPLLPVADVQILAAYVEATVLVTDASKTPRKILLRAKRILDRTHTTIIGVVLNKSPWSDSADVHHYLRSLQRNGRQPKAKFEMSPHTLRVEDMHIDIPSTPSANRNGTVDPEIPTTHLETDSDGISANRNGTVDPEMSIAIPHQDMDADEK